jgi:hypothetical protein
MAITKEEILMGRDKTHASEYTKEVSDNIDKLLVAMNVIRKAYGKPMKVSSGWRPVGINANIKGAAKSSSHTVGMACDIRDTDGTLWNWCLQNLQLIKDCGLYLEDRRWTPNWVHFQTRKVSSGNRIFRAFAGEPPHPTIWDGKYDKKFND